MDSLAFLDRPPKGKPQPVYVLHGDEDFLKRQVLAALKALVLGGGDNDLSLSTHPGDKAAWPAVHDELETLPFLGSHRLVVVEDADPFVTKYRAPLEKYVAAPSARGVLVLGLRSWPANTRLAKLVEAKGTITCKAPAQHRLPEWCVRRAAHYGKQLAAPAAQLLVDLVGPEMGQLDQELAKLATYVGAAERVSAADVDRLVGHSRAEDAWKIFTAISGGRAGEALAMLGRLLDQGEEPLRLLGAFSYQLRRLAQAARLHGQGKPLAAALEEAGVQPWAVKGAEQQLRHLGPRAGRLYDWLLEVDMGLKGSSALPPQVLLERLVVRLAGKAG
jgi:DNA polymerase-3 subunit delta